MAASPALGPTPNTQRRSQKPREGWEPSSKKRLQPEAQQLTAHFVWVRDLDAPECFGGRRSLTPRTMEDMGDGDSEQGEQDEEEWEGMTDEEGLEAENEGEEAPWEERWDQCGSDDEYAPVYDSRAWALFPWEVTHFVRSPTAPGGLSRQAVTLALCAFSASPVIPVFGIDRGIQFV